MNINEMLKSSHFRVIGKMRVDSQNRILLGSKIKYKADCYRVYQNSVGQIFLDPIISGAEAILDITKNKKEPVTLLKGLKQAREGKIRKSKEDFSKYTK